MAQSEGEDENYWPGYVDALTTMTMVLTFIMMVLGITVFSLSQNVSRQLLESVATATNVSAKGSPTSQLKDAVLNEIARLTLERDELRGQLAENTMPQPGPIRPDAQPGPPKQSEEVVASPAAKEPQPVLPDRAQGNEPPPVPGPHPAAASPVPPAVLPSEVADAATQTPPSVAVPARGGSQVDTGLRTGLPLTAAPTEDPRHENAAETPADLVNNPPVPPPAGEARVTLRDPRTALTALPSSGGTISGPGMLDAAPGDPKSPPQLQDPAMRSPAPPPPGQEGDNMAMPVAGDPTIAASPASPESRPPAEGQPPGGSNAAASAQGTSSPSQDTPAPPATVTASPPTSDAAPKSTVQAQSGPPTSQEIAQDAARTDAGKPGQAVAAIDPPPVSKPASSEPATETSTTPESTPYDSKPFAPAAGSSRGEGVSADVKIVARTDPSTPTTAKDSRAGHQDVQKLAERSPDIDQKGGPADPPQNSPVVATRDIKSGAPATLTERSAGAKVEASSVLMTVRFGPRATALDPEAQSAIEDFANEIKTKSGPKDLLIRGLADPEQVGVSEQRRAAYYRALVVRQALIERGIPAAQIATRIEFLRPGDQRDAVEVRLR